MKKIHILTFHDAINYGAILQCYALFRTISQYYECDVLNYKSESVKNRYRLFNIKKFSLSSLKSTIKKLLTLYNDNKKSQKFNAFKKSNIILSKEYNINTLRKEEWTNDDVFVVGSDQVWNINLTNEDYTYLLDFLDENFKNRYSYAASFGTAINDNDVEKIKKYLVKFSNISVREKSTKELLIKNGLNCEYNIDPVFLLSKKEWEKVAKSRNSNEKYTLIYILQGSNEFIKKAIEYSKRKQLKIKIISTGLKRNIKGEYIVASSPEEFLGYFLGADTIFTNSFHGIAFSILFNKKFFYELQKNGSKTNSRLMNIIDLFDLKKQNAELYKLIPDDIDIDYENINKIIEFEKNKSLTYIKNI